MGNKTRAEAERKVVGLEEKAIKRTESIKSENVRGFQ